MTPAERLERRLQGLPVDRPPNLNILMTFAARHVGVTYDQFCRDHRYLVEANLRCNERFGIDLLSTMSDPLREAHDFGAKVTFPYDALPECAEPLVDGPAALRRLRRFDPASAVRMRDRLDAIEAYRRAAGDHWPILGWVEGPLAEAADLRGMNDTLVDLCLQPEFVQELMEVCLAQAEACARAQVQAGAGVVGIGDAVCSLISPELYRTCVQPLEARLVAAIHAAGARAKLHICGNVTHLLEDMVQTGADIVDVDWMVDLGAAVALAGGRCAMNGNFDPVAVVYQGTPQQVRAAVEACLQVGDDRSCVSAGCEIPRDTPPANLAAVDEALRAGGRPAPGGAGRP